MTVRMEDVECGIDGGYERIYDGVIIWVMKDGRMVNRFRGEGSHREARIDELIRSGAYATPDGGSA